MKITVINEHLRWPLCGVNITFSGVSLGLNDLANRCVYRDGAVASLINGWTTHVGTVSVAWE